MTAADDEPPLTAPDRHHQSPPVVTITTSAARAATSATKTPSAAKRQCQSRSDGIFVGCTRSVSYHVSNGLGELFYRLGFTVASHPWNTIIVSWLLVLCCAAGLLRFHSEKNPMKLWIPQNSQFLRDTEWLMSNIQIGYRTQSVLITAPDVLTPEVMHKLALISEEVAKIRAPLGNGTLLQWSDVCFKIPFIAHLPQMPVTERKRPSVESTTPAQSNLLETIFAVPKRRPFNPSIDLSSFAYCPIINSLPLGCMTETLLDLWNYDAERIRRLTRDEILDALNTTTVNPVSGHQTDFVHLLGDVRRNESGHIVAAGSLLTHWMVYVNFSAVDHEKIGNIAGTEDWASEEALAWEAGFLLQMEPLRASLSRNETAVYYSAGRSFGDISAATMFQDMDKVFVGALVMFIYMQLVLSRFGWTEVRMMFGGVGLMSVGMAYIAAIGVCSVFGVSYGPVHTSLPFLLMGLGVDDIFVLMTCWRQVEAMHTGCSMPERVGLMMRHAGSSITVTSITDVVAFLIGASTILPSLESFCIYAAVGVFIVYLLVITFVVAILVLDERRMAQRRNSFIPCVIHNEEKTKLCCQPNLMHRTLKFLFTRVIFTAVGKVLVIVSVLSFAAFSLTNLVQLEQRFDPNWFIPARTYLSKYLAAQEQYYPDIGHEANIFIGAVNYTLEMPKLVRTIEQFENRTDLVQDVSAWIEPFRDFVQVYYEKDIATETLDDTDWREYLSKFLFSHAGGRYQANFIFDTPLQCGEPTGNVTVSTIPFRHRRFADRNQYVPAMYEVKRIVAAAHIESGDAVATVWGKIYGNWITDEVIDTEVLRNILLALVCVMACTLLLIAEPQTCAYIFVCVLLTLIDVCGCMQLWGLTIDLVSCIGLELAVGLCVDYAAHVGHTFLLAREGTREERALETILHIGSAVLYGGGSTLLALAMLANSEAYTFQAFFKIFLLVIVFGLFHGVVFLPVLLSLIGPAPLRSAEEQSRGRRGTVDGARRGSAPDEDEEMVSVSFAAKCDGGGNGRMKASRSQDASVRTEHEDLEAMELVGGASDGSRRSGEAR